MISVNYNDSHAFYPGLINDLLSKSYAAIKGTSQDDKGSFLKFDQDVEDHPQWLGKYVFITTFEGMPIHNLGFEEVIVSTCDNEDFISAQKMYAACGFTETHRFYKDEQVNDPSKKLIGYKIVFRQPGVDAFIIFDHKVLLVLRDNNPNIQNPNLWNLPGGGIEKGESELEALSRELKEEVNLIPKDAQYIDKTVYPDGNVVTKYFVHINAEEKKNLKLGEGQKMDFFSLDEMLNLDVISNLRSYIELNNEELRKNIKKSKFLEGPL